ncbi:MAG: hypothetical protein ABWX96_22395 [Propionibacteriaceae bacterium]
MVTISPIRADQLASALRGMAPPSQAWLYDAADRMVTAARQLGIHPKPISGVSRGRFALGDSGTPNESKRPPTILLAGNLAPEVRPTPVPSQPAHALLSAAQESSANTATAVHQAAVDAALLAREAVRAAADRAAGAALAARVVRSAAVDQAAEAVALRVATAAAAVESEADAAALRVAEAAFDAALLIASTVTPGSERNAALTATLVATAVAGIAIKTAAETAAAAAEVARAAAAAATSASIAAADAAAIVDFEVVCAAEAIRDVATAAAVTLAEQTDAQAKALAESGL